MKKRLSISRKIILFLLNFIMIIDLLTIGISFQLKNVVTDTLCSTTVSELISVKMVAIIKENLNINTDTFKNIETVITENHYINDITSKYMASIIEQLNNGNTQFTFHVDITAELTNLIQSIVHSFKDSTHSSILNKVIDSFSEQIVNQAKNIENTINTYISQNVNTYIQRFDTYIKIYSILISAWFKVLLIVIGIVLFVLCIFDTKSVGTALLSLGGCSLLVGLSYASILFVFASNVFQIISQRYVGETLHLSYTYFITNGMIMIIIGILGIGGSIIKNKKHHNQG